MIVNASIQNQHKHLYAINWMWKLFFGEMFYSLINSIALGLFVDLWRLHNYIWKLVSATKKKNTKCNGNFASHNSDFIYLFTFLKLLLLQFQVNVLQLWVKI